MSLVRDSFAELASFIKRSDEPPFTKRPPQPRAFSGGILGRFILPSVDVHEDEYNITLIEVPGIDGKDIDVHTENNVLTVHGERNFEKEEKEENFHANNDRGYLNISLAKKARAKPKQIKVNFGRKPDPRGQGRQGLGRQGPHNFSVRRLEETRAAEVTNPHSTIPTVGASGARSCRHHLLASKTVASPPSFHSWTQRRFSDPQRDDEPRRPVCRIQAGAKRITAKFRESLLQVYIF
jgi:HSP20 family molecular chaperone IbpA